jgi:hypothetical protein
MVKSEEGRIVLEGRCRIEDAETLLQALQYSPSSIVDIQHADKLHTAVGAVRNPGSSRQSLTRQELGARFESFYQVEGTYGGYSIDRR